MLAHFENNKQNDKQHWELRIKPKENVLTHFENNSRNDK